MSPARIGGEGPGLNGPSEPRCSLHRGVEGPGGLNPPLDDREASTGLKIDAELLLTIIADQARSLAAARDTIRHLTAELIAEREGR